MIMPGFHGGLFRGSHFAKVHPKRKLSSIKQLSPQLYKSIRITMYTLIIWICFISSAVLTQKMYKTPYSHNTNSEQKDYFKNPFGVTLFMNFFGMFYGFLKYQIGTRNTQYTEEVQIPQKYFIGISMLDSFISLGCSCVVILSSYTTYNLIHCCSLLSVVLVAVFCSKYREIILGTGSEFDQSMNVKPKQIVIAGMVVCGIFIFEFFNEKTADGVNKPLNLWTLLLFIMVLMGEGFRPELVMNIRQKFHPRPSLLFYEISRYNFIIILAASILSTQLFSLLAFLWNHDNLAMDLIFITFLSLLGEIFIYRILLSHKQHVIPFILTIRRVLTSVINILYFHHQVSSLQVLGLIVVGLGVALQLVSSYLEIKQKNEEGGGEAIEAKFQQIEEQIQEDTI